MHRKNKTIYKCKLSIQNSKFIIMLNKVITSFKDGEIVKYNFKTGYVILVIRKEIYNLFSTEISWNIGNFKRDCLIDVPLRIKNTYYKSQVNEIKGLLSSLKKVKNKSNELKQLIQMLIQINHDISNQIFIQTKLL